jgi:uncharacterized RDD family membrane protein YckC
VAAAVCPFCLAPTSLSTGYCDVCRQPLPGTPAPPFSQAPPPHPVYAHPPPPGYPYPQPTIPPLAYGPPLPYGVPPGYAYPQPAYYPPASLDPPSRQLAKLTADARWGAGFIDLIIIGAIWVALLLSVYPMFFAVGGSWWHPPRIAVTAGWIYLYYALFEGFAGGTPGKRAVGLVLVDKDLKPITARQAFLRALELFLWPLGLILGTALAQVLVIEKSGQSAGDRLARSFLVKRRYLATAQRA